MSTALTETVDVDVTEDQDGAFPAADLLDGGTDATLEICRNTEQKAFRLGRALTALSWHMASAVLSGSRTMRDTVVEILKEIEAVLIEMLPRQGGGFPRERARSLQQEWIDLLGSESFADAWFAASQGEDPVGDRMVLVSMYDQQLNREIEQTFQNESRIFLAVRLGRVIANALFPRDFHIYVMEHTQAASTVFAAENETGTSSRRSPAPPQSREFRLEPPTTIPDWHVWSREVTVLARELGLRDDLNLVSQGGINNRNELEDFLAQLCRLVEQGLQSLDPDTAQPAFPPQGPLNDLRPERLTIEVPSPAQLLQWPPDGQWHFRDGQFAFRGTRYALGGKSLQLLRIFVENRFPQSVDSIIRGVWSGSNPESKTVTSSISNLNKYLRETFRLIQNPIRSRRDSPTTYSLDEGMLVAAVESPSHPST